MIAAAPRRVLAMKRCVLVGLTVLVILSRGAGAETAAQRGKKALLTKAYNPPTMLLGAYENAWKHWGLKEKPDAQTFDRLYRERYGLHPAPYPNGGLPMGLRKGDTLLGKGTGLTND